MRVTKSDVTLAMSPEEATRLRLMCGILSLSNVRRLCHQANDESESERFFSDSDAQALYATTSKVFDLLKVRDG
jgi:hypothetical protein